MKAAVIVFPGSNCDRDLAIALEMVGFEVYGKAIVINNNKST